MKPAILLLPEKRLDNAFLVGFKRGELYAVTETSHPLHYMVHNLCLKNNWHEPTINGGQIAMQPAQGSHPNDVFYG